MVSLLFNNHLTYTICGKEGTNEESGPGIFGENVVNLHEFHNTSWREPAEISWSSYTAAADVTVWWPWQILRSMLDKMILPWAAESSMMYGFGYDKFDDILAGREVTVPVF